MCFVFFFAEMAPIHETNLLFVNNLSVQVKKEPVLIFYDECNLILPLL